MPSASAHGLKFHVMVCLIGKFSVLGIYWLNFSLSHDKEKRMMID